MRVGQGLAITRLLLQEPRAACAATRGCLMATSTTPHRSVGPGISFPPSVAGTRHFFRHFGEMFLAMMVGMFVLAGLDSAAFAAAGTSIPDVKDSAPEVWGLLMALNMTVGMTVWMRHRSHSWAMCVEMAGAMFVPAVAAIVLFWCSVIHGVVIGPVTMAGMVPAMIAVMLLRRTEYSQPVRSNA